MYVTELLIMHERMCHLVLCSFNDHDDAVAPIYSRQVHVHVHVHVILQPALTHYNRHDVSPCRYAATKKRRQAVTARFHHISDVTYYLLLSDDVFFFYNTCSIVGCEVQCSSTVLLHWVLLHCLSTVLLY